MKRDEFIKEAEKLKKSELQEIANNLRIRSSSRISEEVQKMFRKLDDKTKAEEMNLDTEFGRTHFYLISADKDDSELSPIVINVHGGGWCLPHTERDIYFCRRIAYKTGCKVIDIDYVLAPEYPYPAAIEEIELFIRTASNGLLEKYGADKKKVILCGQSAGGNLLGAISLRCKCFDKMNVLKQILCYMPTDNYRNRFGETELDERDQSTEYYGFFYNDRFEDRKLPDVSLVYASEEEIRRIPDTDIITAGLDNLMPEGRAYYEKIRDAGIQSSYRCFENSKHGFLVNLYDEWEEGEDYLVSLINEVI